MRWESPWALLLFIPLLLSLRWAWRRYQPAAMVYTRNLTSAPKNRNLLWVPFLIKTLGLSLLILAMARPQASFNQSERTVSGVDIVLTVDVSQSMEIEDLTEKSRVDVAKETLIEFAKNRLHDRLGLVIFSGEAFTMTPPTLDHELVLDSIAQITTGVVKDGTAIGDGLATAVGRLKESKAKTKIIVLLTDGENNVGQIDPLTAGDLAQQFDIRVYAIAIGSEGRVRMPNTATTVFGQKIKTYQYYENHLNTELLEKIAAKTQGKFYRATDAQALKNVFAEIDRFEKTEVKTKIKIDYDEKYPPLLWFGFLLIAFEQLWTRFAVRRFP